MRFASGWNLISLQESSLSNKIRSLFHFGWRKRATLSTQTPRYQSLAGILLWPSCRWRQLSPSTSAHVTCILQRSHTNSDKVSQAYGTWKYIYLQGIITLDWRRMINNILYSAVGYLHSKAGKGDLFLHFIAIRLYGRLCAFRGRMLILQILRPIRRKSRRVWNNIWGVLWGVKVKLCLITAHCCVPRMVMRWKKKWNEANANHNWVIFLSCV